MGISNISSNLRPGICTSSTRPTTPYEGQVIYETDTNRTLVWDNSAWIGVAQSGGAGLVKMIPTVSGTGATVSSTGTITVASGGNSVTISNCFTSSFDVYDVIVSNFLPASGTEVLAIQLRAGSSTSNTGYYYGTTYGGNSYSGTTTVTTVGSANASSWGTDILASASGNPAGFRCTIFNPYQNSKSSYVGQSNDARTGGNARLGFSGFHNVSASYDSLVLFASNSANISTLTVQIYGYN